MKAPAASDQGSLLTKGTVDSYVSAVIELWRVQVANGNGNTKNPRGAAVRGLLEQRGRQESKPDRAAHKDLSTDEWLRIQDLLLSGAAAAPQNLRTRVDLLFGRFYLRGGKNRRKMELADLSLLDYPSSEGPTQCGCLVGVLRDNKMNETAKKEFMGAIRHKDPLLCTQSALAQLLFWRWHIAGEAPPSFRRHSDWHRIKVLIGRDPERELSSPTQLHETRRIFGEAGVTSTKTHLPKIHGSLSQIRQACRWDQGVLCQADPTHLPRQFIRVAAGFAPSPGDYFLVRAVHEPPAILRKQLWPWIEEWEPRLEARARGRGWAEGGLDEDDPAADGFLGLMRRLRTVLLQDLAVLEPRYPALPCFAHALFRGPEWDAFARLVRAGATGAKEPQSLLLQRALPELSSVLENSREAALQSVQKLAGQLKNQLRDIQSSLDALLQGQVPITTVSYFGTGPPDPAAPPAAALAPEPAPAPAPASPTERSLPVVTALPRVYTVVDVWQEWTVGLEGQPAFRELGERWGTRWRPGNAVKVQFCRRKVILDEIRARIIRGRTEEEAVAELELLRAGRGLNQLVEELRRRRQQPLEDPERRQGGTRGRGRGQRGAE